MRARLPPSLARQRAPTSFLPRSTFYTPSSSFSSAVGDRDPNLQNSYAEGRSPASYAHNARPSKEFSDHFAALAKSIKSQNSTDPALAYQTSRDFRDVLKKRSEEQRSGRIGRRYTEAELYDVVHAGPVGEVDPKDVERLQRVFKPTEKLTDVDAQRVSILAKPESRR